MLDAILRVSLGVMALYATLGAAESVIQLAQTGDRTMALYALGYGYAAGVCGLSALTPPASGGQP